VGRSRRADVREVAFDDRAVKRRILMKERVGLGERKRVAVVARLRAYRSLKLAIVIGTRGDGDGSASVRGAGASAFGRHGRALRTGGERSGDSRRYHHYRSAIGLFRHGYTPSAEVDYAGAYCSGVKAPPGFGACPFRQPDQASPSWTVGFICHPASTTNACCRPNPSSKQAVLPWGE